MSCTGPHLVLRRHEVAFGNQPSSLSPGGSTIRSPSGSATGGARPSVAPLFAASVADGYKHSIEMRGSRMVLTPRLSRAFALSSRLAHSWGTSISRRRPQRGPERTLERTGRSRPLHLPVRSACPKPVAARIPLGRSRAQSFTDEPCGRQRARQRPYYGSRVVEPFIPSSRQTRRRSRPQRAPPRRPSHRAPRQPRAVRVRATRRRNRSCTAKSSIRRRGLSNMRCLQVPTVVIRYATSSGARRSSGVKVGIDHGLPL